MVNESFQLFPLFASPVACFDLGDSLIGFERDAANTTAMRETNSGSVAGAYISVDVQVLDRFPEAKAVFSDVLRKYIDAVWRSSKLEMRITTSWLTATLENGFSQSHSHSNSIFSAVYYFHGPSSYAPLIFDKYGTIPSQLFLGTPDEQNDFNSEQWEYTPTGGKLLVFPSYLRHRVGVHPDPEPRRSLAFNTFPRMPFGEYDSTLMG